MKKKPTLKQMVEAATSAGAKINISLEPNRLDPAIVINRALEIQRTLEHGMVNGVLSVATVIVLVQATIVTLSQAKCENPS